jgi:hypothetical protein
MTFACVAWRNYRIYWAVVEPPGQRRRSAFDTRLSRRIANDAAHEKKPVGLTPDGLYLDILGFALDSLYI